MYVSVIALAFTTEVDKSPSAGEVSCISFGALKKW
jgi:hypothetical protein